MPQKSPAAGNSPGGLVKPSSASRRRLLNAEAAREAHLLRLRQRQASVIMNHTNLSEQDRDMLMERGQFGIDASRVSANVAEIVLYGPDTSPKQDTAHSAAGGGPDSPRTLG